MRILLPAFLVSTAMATLSQTFCDGNRPRITHYITSSEVFSYPSAGGFVRKSITQAELEWLGLKAGPENRISNESAPIAADKMHASDDVNEEDAFSIRLMQLGGRWWPNQTFYRRHTTANLPYGHHYPPHLDIGYTSEGILVLRTAAGNSVFFDLPDVEPEKPGTWSRLALCGTMEERCKVLRDFGAVMFDSVEECPDLPNSLEEGIAQGKRYAELMRKMEDRKYVDEWLMSL